MGRGMAQREGKQEDLFLNLTETIKLRCIALKVRQTATNYNDDATPTLH